MKVGVVGFTGYAGQELLGLFSRHGGVDPVLLDDRPENQAQHNAQPCTKQTAKKSGLQVVFLATDHKLSLQYAPVFLEAGCRVVDLSGAYRLKADGAFEKWYHEPHPQAQRLAGAVYGLPEFYREQIREAQLVANPGCYPTAASLALRPLVEAGVVDLQDKIVCNASSGISGAGRRAVESGQVGVPAENFVPYKMLNHRHVPEILEHSQLAATPEKFNFVPHLLPAFRGILEAIYVTVKPGVQARELEEIYQRRYKSEPCLVIYNQGQIPQLQDVQHTNCCAIGVTVNEYRQAVIVSAIDNLVKGAAGQALQNMNIMMGFEETRGLPLDAKNFSRTTVEGHHQQPGQFPIMMPGRVLVKP